MHGPRGVFPGALKPCMLTWRCIVRSRWSTRKVGALHDALETDDRYRPHCNRASSGRRDRGMVDHRTGMEAGALLVSDVRCGLESGRIVKNSLPRLGYRHPLTRLQGIEWPCLVCNGRPPCFILRHPARSVTALAYRRSGFQHLCQRCPLRASGPFRVSYGVGGVGKLSVGLLYQPGIYTHCKNFARTKPSSVDGSDELTCLCPDVWHQAIRGQSQTG